MGGHAVLAIADPPASRRVYMRAVLQYAMSSRARSMFPASQFRGLSGSGLHSSASTARHTECRVQAGDHASFRMSRQISPVFQCTFGWKIFVSNAARGGASGYDSGSEKRTTNVPVSNGVSSGPFSVALHRKRFSPSGARRMVGSASRAASLISFSRRERLDMAPRAAAGRGNARDVTSGARGTPRGRHETDAAERCWRVEENFRMYTFSVTRFRVS